MKSTESREMEYGNFMSIKMLKDIISLTNQDLKLSVDPELNIISINGEPLGDDKGKIYLRYNEKGKELRRKMKKQYEYLNFFNKDSELLVQMFLDFFNYDAISVKYDKCNSIYYLKLYDTANNVIFKQVFHIFEELSVNENYYVSNFISRYLDTLLYDEPEEEYVLDVQIQMNERGVTDSEPIIIKKYSSIHSVYYTYSKAGASH